MTLPSGENAQVSHSSEPALPRLSASNWASLEFVFTSRSSTNSLPLVSARDLSGERESPPGQRKSPFHFRSSKLLSEVLRPVCMSQSVKKLCFNSILER